MKNNATDFGAMPEIVLSDNFEGEVKRKASHSFDGLIMQKGDLNGLVRKQNFKAKPGDFGLDTNMGFEFNPGSVLENAWLNFRDTVVGDTVHQVTSDPGVQAAVQKSAMDKAIDSVAQTVYGVKNYAVENPTKTVAIAAGGGIFLAAGIYGIYRLAFPKKRK